MSLAVKGKAESDRESRWVSSVLFALVECRSFGSQE